MLSLEINLLSFSDKQSCSISFSLVGVQAQLGKPRVLRAFFNVCVHVFGLEGMFCAQCCSLCCRSQRVGTGVCGLSVTFSVEVSIQHRERQTIIIFIFPGELYVSNH